MSEQRKQHIMEVLGKSNIFLMGFMGVGKSRVGSILSEKLGFKFTDTDNLVTQKAGISISELFTNHGEAYFRQLETEAVRLVSSSDKQVIALGGGAVIRSENWKIISENGITVNLSYPPEIILRRIKKNQQRPLLNLQSEQAQLEKIIRLLEERKPYYALADIILHLNKEIPAENVADMIIGYLGENY